MSTANFTHLRIPRTLLSAKLVVSYGFSAIFGSEWRSAGFVLFCFSTVVFHFRRPLISRVVHNRARQCRLYYVKFSCTCRYL